MNTYAYTPAGTEVSGTPTTTAFTYGNTNHPDRLTAYNGATIGYNAMGCPISYGDKSLIWNKGKLSGINESSGIGFNASSKSYTFAYNALGQRIIKTYAYFPGAQTPVDYMTDSNCVFTYDNAGRLIYEKRSENHKQNYSDTREFTYLYDESGMIGFTYSKNGSSPTTHYYHRNLQGDVIAIYSINGAIQAEYAYDAWGNCTITNSTNEDIATANAIRYRGYYWDSETNLYYLNARYYSPEWRRFISPDDTSYLDPESVNGLNLYCYCNNDPVNFVDPSGHFAIGLFLIGLAATSLVGWGISEALGTQIAGGISSIFNGGAAISTGMSLCAFGPWGIVAGAALMLVGGSTIGFGINEIISGITGVNYIQSWTGWSDSIYNGVYTGLNIASAFGSIAGNIGMRFASNKILNAIVQDPSKVNNYKLWQIKTFGKYTSIYTPGTLQKGGHMGQGYTLTHNKHASLGYIQWHPGGGHHGPLAYWKITSSFNKAARFYYLTGLPF